MGLSPVMSFTSVIWLQGSIQGESPEGTAYIFWELKLHRVDYIQRVCPETRSLAVKMLQKAGEAM